VIQYVAPYCHPINTKPLLAPPGEGEATSSFHPETASSHPEREKPLQISHPERDKTLQSSHPERDKPLHSSHPEREKPLLFIVPKGLVELISGYSPPRECDLTSAGYL